MLKNLFQKSVTSFLGASTLNTQQIRTTFVLKRKFPVPLAKKNQAVKKMRGRHFVYDLVEDTNVKKKENIDVVLTSYVEGIGRKGEVVNLKPNIAYEKLLLPGLAVYHTPENVEKYSKFLNSIDDDEERHSSPFAQRTKDIMERRVFSIILNKDQPWEIQPWHIRSSLRKAGVYVMNDSQIEMPAEKITGPDLRKQNKEFYCTVTINNLEKARIRCRIHHWSTDPTNRLPYIYEHWLNPAEALMGDETTPMETSEK